MPSECKSTKFKRVEISRKKPLKSLHALSDGVRFAFVALGVSGKLGERRVVPLLRDGNAPKAAKSKRLAQEAVLRELCAQSARFFDVSVSRNSRFIVLLSESCELLIVCDVANDRVHKYYLDALARPPAAHLCEILSLTVSNDGTRVALVFKGIATGMKCFQLRATSETVLEVDELTHHFASLFRDLELCTLSVFFTQYESQFALSLFLVGASGQLTLAVLDDRDTEEASVLQGGFSDDLEVDLNSVHVAIWANNSERVLFAIATKKHVFLAIPHESELLLVSSGISRILQHQNNSENDVVWTATTASFTDCAFSATGDALFLRVSQEPGASRLSVNSLTRSEQYGDLVFVCTRALSVISCHSLPCGPTGSVESKAKQSWPDTVSQSSLVVSHDTLVALDSAFKPTRYIVVANCAKATKSSVLELLNSNLSKELTSAERRFLAVTESREKQRLFQSLPDFSRWLSEPSEPQRRSHDALIDSVAAKLDELQLAKLPQTATVPKDTAVQVEIEETKVETEEASEAEETQIAEVKTAETRETDLAEELRAAAKRQLEAEKPSENARSSSNAEVTEAEDTKETVSRQSLLPHEVLEMLSKADVLAICRYADTHAEFSLSLLRLCVALSLDAFVPTDDAGTLRLEVTTPQQLWCLESDKLELFESPHAALRFYERISETASPLRTSCAVTREISLALAKHESNESRFLLRQLARRASAQCRHLLQHKAKFESELEELLTLVAAVELHLFRTSSAPRSEKGRLSWSSLRAHFELLLHDAFECSRAVQLVCCSLFDVACVSPSLRRRVQALLRQSFVQFLPRVCEEHTAPPRIESNEQRLDSNFVHLLALGTAVGLSDLHQVIEEFALCCDFATRVGRCERQRNRREVAKAAVLALQSLLAIAKLRAEAMESSRPLRKRLLDFIATTRTGDSTQKRLASNAEFVRHLRTWLESDDALLNEVHTRESTHQIKLFFGAELAQCELLRESESSRLSHELNRVIQGAFCRNVAKQAHREATTFRNRQPANTLWLLLTQLASKQSVPSNANLNYSLQTTCVSIDDNAPAEVESELSELESVASSSSSAPSLAELEQMYGELESDLASLSLSAHSIDIEFESNAGASPTKEQLELTLKLKPKLELKPSVRLAPLRSEMGRLQLSSLNRKRIWSQKPLELVAPTIRTRTVPRPSGHLWTEDIEAVGETAGVAHSQQHRPLLLLNGVEVQQRHETLKPAKKQMPRSLEPLMLLKPVRSTATQCDVEVDTSKPKVLVQETAMVPEKPKATTQIRKVTPRFTQSKALLHENLRRYRQRKFSVPTPLFRRVSTRPLVAPFLAATSPVSSPAKPPLRKAAPSTQLIQAVPESPTKATTPPKQEQSTPRSRSSSTAPVLQSRIHPKKRPKPISVSDVDNESIDSMLSKVEELSYRLDRRLTEVGIPPAAAEQKAFPRQRVQSPSVLKSELPPSPPPRIREFDSVTESQESLSDRSTHIDYVVHELAHEDDESKQFHSTLDDIEERLTASLIALSQRPNSPKAVRRRASQQLSVLRSPRRQSSSQPSNLHASLSNRLHLVKKRVRARSPQPPPRPIVTPAERLHTAQSVLDDIAEELSVSEYSITSSRARGMNERLESGITKAMA